MKMKKAFLTATLIILSSCSPLLFITESARGSPTMQKYDRPDIYHTRPETWNLDRAKAPGFADRKRAHIANIAPFTIDEPRELSRGPKSKFMTECGINETYTN